MPSFPFDPEFQKRIIASFLEADLGEGCECLREEYFEDEVLADIAETVRAFYEDHREPPTKEALTHELKERGQAPGRKLTDYLQSVEEIYEAVGHNGGYYRDKAKDFAKAKKLGAALKASYAILEAGDYEKALAEIQSKAQSNGSIGSHVVNFFATVTERALGYVQAREKGGTEEGRVKTGFYLLDERMRGGLGVGETGVVLAPAKHGKTTALISLASAALLNGVRVLYVTLELSGKLIATKFETNLYGSPFSVISKKTKSFLDDIQALHKRIAGDHLHIAEFSTKSLTVNKLEETILKVEPKIVFLDYAALLKSARREDRRFEITDIHEGIRGVAGRCKVPIWTAHQTNRSSLERKEIGIENIAEDFNVAAIADILISLNQNEDEKRRGTLRIAIVGNRLGESGGVIEANCSWMLSRITPTFEVKENL